MKPEDLEIQTDAAGNSIFPVRVFGANLQGFHGAGSAGKLWDSQMKSWRDHVPFRKALSARERQSKTGRLDVEEQMVGEYNTLGQTGFQRGRKGYSYGIITTERPGQQGCITDEVMFFELKRLKQAALERYNKRFVCLNFGLKRPDGFSWWSQEQMREFWLALGPIPANLIPPSFI